VCQVKVGRGKISLNFINSFQFTHRTKKLIYVLWVCVYNQLVNFFLPNFSAGKRDEEGRSGERMKEGKN
jgi:hypothetical protein